MENPDSEILLAAEAAQEIARELLDFELQLGFPLTELRTWPDDEVSSLFLVRALVLWRARFPSLDTDPLMGPRRGPIAREALVDALSKRAAALRSIAAVRASDLSSPQRLARLFEDAAEAFRRSLLRMRGH
jgi:hypothetical protein